MAALTQTHELPATQRRSMLSAMRSSNFRLYFAGQIVSISGTWIQTIAQGYLVFLLTKSELWLGIVACAAGLPVILMAPIGGVVIDRFPRRAILVFTQSAQMILAFILAWLTFAGTVQVWHIVLLAFLLGMTNTLDVPARQLIIVEMVGRDDLYSGIALNSIMNNVGRILGPAVAGLALIQFGTAWCFFMNGLSYLAVIFSLVVMKVPYAIHAVSQVSPLRQLREGVRYSMHEPLVASLLLLTAISGLLVFPLTQMMPAFADIVLHSPDQGYAAINVGTGIGAVFAGVLVGWIANRLGYGRLIVWSMLLTSLAMVLLAFQVNILIASFITGFYGIFMLLEFISLNTALQTIVPDAFRGRVMGLYSLGLVGFTPFGALALGAIASVYGTPFGIALYGIFSAVLGGLVILHWPVLLKHGLGSYRAEPEIPAEVVPAEVITRPAAGD